MGTEIAFEELLFARETTRFTAVTPPTHYVTMTGMAMPEHTMAEPDESRGTLAKVYRSKTTDRRGALTAQGSLDPDLMPFLAQMFLNGSVTSPTTPGGGTLSKLWTFPRTIVSDNLLAATTYCGDPNVQIWQFPGTMITEVKISDDVAGNDAVSCEISGFCAFPAKVSAPALPTQIVGDLLIGADKQVWLDTSSAIGTTEITTQVVRNELTVPTGAVPKKTASGPTGTRTITRVGRAKAAPEAIFEVEADNSTIYDIWAANTEVKLRVRYNGVLIEGVLYTYVQYDIYGILSAFEHGENEGTNRTHRYTLPGRYTPAIASDLQMTIQNQKATV